MKQAIEVGQVWRDKHGDASGWYVNKRTIRIEEETAAAGYYLCATLTDVSGKALAKPRNTMVSVKSLRAGYVLVE